MQLTISHPRVSSNSVRSVSGNGRVDRKSTAVHKCGNAEGSRFGEESIPVLEKYIAGCSSRVHVQFQSTLDHEFT